MEKFGAILKELREEKNLSQLQLSRLVDISQSSIARYELNQAEPRLSDIRKLAIFFGVTADYLVGMEEQTDKFGRIKLSKFSENLRQALQGSHMAQSELALKLQTTQQTVSRWLKGINEPDLDTLLKICLYLNETPNSLLGYDEIPKEIFEEYKNK